MINHTHIKNIFLLPLALLTLGCESALTSVGTSLATTDALSIFREEEVNTTQKNYAAADYLLQQARTYITRHDVIKVQTLLDREDPRVFSALGRSIPEQVGVRLSQLGYKVDLSEVETAIDNPGYRKPALTSADKKPDFILSGSYLRKPQDLDVGLRVTEVATGQVIAVFDYTMAMNKDLAKRSQPETRIFKVE